MANFTLIRNLLELERDNGLKRLLLGLYCASDSNSSGDADQGRKYIACSEQVRSSKDSDWIATRKGITVRRGELKQLIAALQAADFDVGPDNKGLSDREYAEQCCDW